MLSGIGNGSEPKRNGWSWDVRAGGGGGGGTRGAFQEVPCGNKLIRHKLSDSTNNTQLHLSQGYAKNIHGLNLIKCDHI